MYFFAKAFLSGLIIAGVTSLSEKTPVLGALLKSLPVTSMLVFLIMRYEGRTNQEIARMSWDILYLVIPSLLLFLVLPIFLQKGLGFWGSLGLGFLIMCLGYTVTLKIMS